MAHKRRREPSLRGTNLRQSTCPDCGKWRYPSRKDARAKARQIYPGSQARAYKCGDYWHLTSMPTGETTKFRERGTW